MKDIIWGLLSLIIGLCIKLEMVTFLFKDDAYRLEKLNIVFKYIIFYSICYLLIGFVTIMFAFIPMIIINSIKICLSLFVAYSISSKYIQMN